MPHQACPCRYSTDETPFQYGWNPVPIRVEPGSGRDGTRTDLNIGALRIFILYFSFNESKVLL